MTDHDPAAWVFTCKTCKGTGLIPNTYFEECARNRQPHTEYGRLRGGDCDRCEISEECGEGERIACIMCHGAGVKLVYTLNWELIREPIPREGVD